MNLKQQNSFSSTMEQIWECNIGLEDCVCRITHDATGISLESVMKYIISCSSHCSFIVKITQATRVCIYILSYHGLNVSFSLLMIGQT